MLDLHLDNKWRASSANEAPTRCNALVFALSPYVGSDGVATIQRKAAQKNPLEFRERILAFYLSKCPDSYEIATDAEETPGLDNTHQKQWASLVLWDLLCLHCVSEAPSAFDKISACSMLVSESTGEAKSIIERIALIIDPLKNFCTKQPPGTPVILGCQELPTDPNSDAWLASVLDPTGLCCRRQQADPLTNGFVHSKSLDKGFVDMSEAVKADLEAFLGTVGVPEKTVTTTLRRTQVGVYNLSADGGRPFHIAVVNFHCKSFKKQTKAQGQMMAKCLELASKLEPAPGVVVQEAVIVGDMNLEAPWPKGTSAADQRAAVESAEQFCIPVTNRANMAPYGNELNEAGLVPHPEIDFFTTLKLRTRFQAQPEKEGDINVSRKDFVITKAGVRIDDLLVGGRDDATGIRDGNMGLLMPSRLWPGDHFAILAMINFTPTLPEAPSIVASAAVAEA